MRKELLFFLFIFCFTTANQLIAQQNVSISDVNATPDASSVLDVSSTTKGMLIPRVALSATNAAAPITLPQTSLLVYNTAIAGTPPFNVTPGYYYNAGTPTVPDWARFYAGSAAGTEWKLLGNAGTTAGTNFLGTTDAVDLVFKTDNSEKMRVLSGGNVGIGTGTPGDKLDVFPSGGKSVLLGGGATTGSELKLTNSGVVHYSIYNSGNGNLTFANTSSIFQTNTLGTGLMSITSVGNVGIGTSTPAYKLDLANGTFGFGSSNVRTESRDDAGLQGNAGAQSGFFETVNPTNYPVGASSWWHLIDVRHSNPGNNFAMQFAGSFWDQNLYFRKTINSPTTPWTQILTTASNLAWMTTGNAGTVANTNFIGTTDAIDFVVRTTNAERMRVLSGGNVGIGTSAPLKPLDVAGSGGIRISQSANSSNTNEIYFQDNGQIRSADDNHRLIFDRSSDIMEMREYGDLIFSPGATASTRTQKVTMKASGNVGIGVAAPAATLHVYGVNAPTCAIITSNASYFNDWPGGWGGGLASWDLCVASIRLSGTSTRSDERLKKNIQDLQGMNALDIIDKLRPVSFGYKDPRMTREKTYGFIAQEVQKILPEIVEVGTDSMQTLGMSYTDLIPILTQGMKEQQVQILDLKTQNELYQKRIESLENKLLELSNAIEKLNNE